MSTIARQTRYAHLLRPLIALGALSGLAGLAHAAGTDAGTNVENTFVLNYDVAGIEQPPITNDTDPASQPPGAQVQGAPTEFTVDRVIDLTVTAQTPTVIVAPGATGTNATQIFDITNDGNDNQSYSFSLQDGTDSNGADPNFDATPYVISYVIDTNSDGNFSDETPIVVNQVATDTATTAEITPDIAPDQTFRVIVTGTVPTSQGDGDADDLILVAETRDPTAWIVEPVAPTAGADTTEETGNNAITGAAQNVFADGDGPGTEGAGDGQHSAESRFLVASPDLVAAKAVAVVATEGGAPADCQSATTPPAPNDQFSVPGACIEYVITVENTGSTSATDVDILDILPAEITFASAVFANFEPTPAPVLTAPGAGTDCDGTNTTCPVQVTGGTLAAGNTATLTIRALVD